VFLKRLQYGNIQIMVNQMFHRIIVISFAEKNKQVFAIYFMIIKIII